MRALAGAIMFLASAIALAGGLIAEATGKSSYGFGMMGILGALVIGGLGFAVLLSDYASSRKG